MLLWQELIKDMSFSREKAVDILMKAGIMDFSQLPNKDVIDGKELFSTLIPNDFNFTGHAREKDESGDDKVIIKDGKLIKGVMDRNNLGEGTGLLLRNMHKKYGQDFMVKYLGDLFRLGITVLLQHGFTAAISDSDLSDEAKKQIKDTLNKAEADVDDLITRVGTALRSLGESSRGVTVESVLALVLRSN